MVWSPIRGGRTPALRVREGIQLTQNFLSHQHFLRHSSKPITDTKGKYHKGLFYVSCECCYLDQTELRFFFQTLLLATNNGDQALDHS